MQLFFIPQAPTAPSSTPLDIYLSSANGNDANNGLTPATAVATFSRVWELLPTFQTQPFVVHVDGGSSATLVTDYAYTPPPKNVQVGANAFIVIYGDGAGQSTHDGFYVALSGRTCTGASTSVQLVDTAGGLAANAFQGMTIEMLDGPAAGSRKLIVENTTNTLYPVAAFCTAAGGASTPANGNAYRVVRPNVRLLAYGALAYEGTCLHLVNVRLPVYAAGQDSPTLVNKNASFFFGVEGGSDEPVSVENGSVYCGVAAAAGGGFIRPAYVQVMYPLLLAALGSPVTVASGAWDGWGFTKVGGTYGGFVAAFNTYGEGAEFTGYACGSIYASGSRAQVNLYGCGLFSGLALENGASCALDTMSFNYANTRMVASYVNLTSARLHQGGYDNGPFIISATGTATALTMLAGSEYLAYGNLTINHAGTGPQLYIGAGCSFVQSYGTLSTSGATSPIGTVDGGRLTAANTIYSPNMTLAGSTGLVVRSRGVLALAAAGGSNTITASAGAALTMSEGASADMRRALTLTGTVTSGTNQDAVLSLEGAGTSFNQTAGTLTVSNTNVGTNANGIYVGKGANASFLGGASTAVTTAGGVSSYGAVALGAGLISFSSQPSSVVGNGAGNDLLVDAAAHPDTDLSVSLSSVTSTSGARISRAA